MPAIIIASLVAFEIMSPNVYEEQIHTRMHVPLLYKTGLQLLHIKTAEEKRLDEEFERFCGTAAGDTTKVTQSLDVKNASFDDIDAAIKKAYTVGAPEPIALLRDSIVQTVRTVDAADTRLGKDAMTSVGEEFANKVTAAGKRFSDRFFEPTNKLNTLFLGFEKAGFTQSSSMNPVKIGGVEHEVTNLELFLYRYWYASISDPSYKKLKLAKRTQVNAILVAYLEQVNELLHATNDALAALATVASADIQKAQTLTFKDSLDILFASSPSDTKAGFDISLVGGTILHERHDFDESFRWQLCAAQKYYEPLSMYNISGYYASGVEATTTPDAPTVRVPLKQDLHAAYFWNMVLVLIDSLQYGFFTDSSATLGWNTIGAIDAIQNEGKFTPAELASIEKEARTFVEKKYPTVGSSGLEASVHSAAAAVDAIGAAAGLPKEELNTQTETPRKK